MRKLLVTLLAVAATTAAVFAVSGTNSAKPAACGPDCTGCGCTEACCGK